MENRDLNILSLTDFAVILYKGKALFLGLWLFIVLAFLAYALFADRVYKVSGIINIGKFAEDYLEDGEFVTQKLKDYSFIKSAIETSGVQLDIPVSRLQKSIDTELVNELKKTSEVGLVRLTVYYKGDEKAVAIFKALTGKLIEEHGQMLDRSLQVLRDLEHELGQEGEKAAQSADTDENLLREYAKQPKEATVPSHLLFQHTMSEKRWFRASLLKDLNQVRIDAETVTHSYNTYLGAEPKLPDTFEEPQLVVTMLMGIITASIIAILSVFAVHLLKTELLPRIQETKST